MSAVHDLDDKKFEVALQNELAAEKHDFPSYIGGLKVASGTDFPCSSPVDSTIIFGRFQEPEPGTMAAAARSADRAFGPWSKTAPAVRAKTVGDVAEAVAAHRYQLAAQVLLSSGMTRGMAVAEVDRLVDVLRQAAQDALTASGKPTGVWAVICTHSSPLASPMGYAGAAIAAGDTVVLRPSWDCPVPCYTVYRYFVSAGLPDGVLNVVADRLPGSAQDLANDPAVTGIVATGTGKLMEDLMFLQVDEDVGFINEIKGMNPALVLHPNDLKKAAADVLTSAFSYSGQGLYGCSKVVVLAEEEQDFTKALVERAKDFSVGDPAEAGTRVGPLISGPEADRFEKLLKDRRDFVLCGGRRVKKEFTENGRYYSPALLAGLDDGDDLMYMDSGLPLLVIKAVGTPEEAFADLEDTECGLSAGIFTREQALIDRLKKALPDAACYVNVPSTVLIPAAQALVRNFRR
ncbi:MAG: aldehyde dehydrogenase family protein [Candidatus Methanomethylophilus sp.]|nr:aldehyde dehydrogenase family protein [Methanomethylophilus sp.]